MIASWERGLSGIVSRFVLALLVVGMFSFSGNLGTECNSDIKVSTPISAYENITTHKGDLIITGSQTYVIENCTYLQTGNVYVEDRAKLLIKNAEVRINQTYFEQSELRVEDYAVMEVKDSNVQWDYGTLRSTFVGNSTALFDGLTNVGEYSDVEFLEFSKAFFDNFSFTGSPGSDIKFQDYSLGYISNSKMPALSSSDTSQLEILDTRIEIFELWFGYAGETVQVNGLKSGFFEYLDLKEKIASSHHSFDVKLNRTSVNWWLDVCSDSKTTISDSTIAMFGIVVREGVSSSVEGLKPGFCESASIGQIELSRTQVTEFVRLICNGICTISDSKFDLMTWGSDWHANILNSLVDSIDVRGVGSFCFDNTTWRGGLGTRFSDFYISGNLSCGHIGSWFSSNITRNYNIEVSDSYHEPTISDASLILKSKENITVWNGTTDDQGKANFNVTFADGNYTETLRLEAAKGNWSSMTNVTFVSTTPIVFLSPLPPPPVAFFTYDPEKPVTSEQIVFNASKSYSPKGSITGYEWNFGDGDTATVAEPIIDHSYHQPGKYNVTLKVTDNNTLWDVTSQIMTAYYETDFNRDGKVNIQDITVIAVAYGCKPGDSKWNAVADLDKNGWINIIDMTMVAKDYGKTV
jgi:hypothetical protein